MDAIEAGHGQLRSLELEHEREVGPIIDPEPVKLRADFYATHGAKIEGLPKCFHCKSEFVNVVCPVNWPIDTIALTCSGCGRVMDYIDGLLLFTPQRAFKETKQNRQWVVRRRYALDLETSASSTCKASSYQVAKELVLLGIEMGVPDDVIATEMGVDVLWVEAVAKHEGMR